MTPPFGNYNLPYVVSVLGAGQLGRMLALAGIPLGLKFRFMDPVGNGECIRMLGEFKQGSFTSPADIDWLSSGSTVVTYELEHVPPEHLGKLNLRPGLKALTTTQNRIAEKTFLKKIGISLADFVAIDGEDYAERKKQLASALKTIDGKSILKTAFQGYDGKGQISPNTVEDGEPLIRDSYCVLERKIKFTKELSLISVRGSSGEIVHYPLTENIHDKGILRWSIVKTSTSPLQKEAEEINESIMRELDYVGVMTTEFFDCKKKLIVNEIAPRVHNSGHWTIEGAFTSQFENHLRAIVNLPLGSTDLINECLMVNILGRAAPAQVLLRKKDLHLHWYDKEPKDIRKVGHVTLVGKGASNSAVELADLLQADRKY